MCCVQYEMLSCSLKDFISFVVDAFAQAYCSHLKRTNTLFCPLICDIAIYHLPLLRVWDG